MEEGRKFRLWSRRLLGRGGPGSDERLLVEGEEASLGEPLARRSRVLLIASVSVHAGCKTEREYVRSH